MAILVVVLVGCVKNHFHRSHNVSDTFEQYQMLADHSYYYFGREHAPDAVVGIMEGWKFQTTKWKTVESEDQMRGLVERMKETPGTEFNILPNGAQITNDVGNNIGVWYSPWETPILRFTGDTTFTISDPVPRFQHGVTDGNGDGHIVIGD